MTQWKEEGKRDEGGRLKRGKSKPEGGVPPVFPIVVQGRAKLCILAKDVSVDGSQTYRAVCSVLIRP